MKHHGQKPYSCDICKKQFVAKCNLVNHMWQHKNQRQRPFKCTQCKKVNKIQTHFVTWCFYYYCLSLHSSLSFSIHLRSKCPFMLYHNIKLIAHSLFPFCQDYCLSSSICIIHSGSQSFHQWIYQFLRSVLKCFSKMYLFGKTYATPETNQVFFHFFHSFLHHSLSQTFSSIFCGFLFLHLTEFLNLSC